MPSILRKNLGVVVCDRAVPSIEPKPVVDVTRHVPGRTTNHWQVTNDHHCVTQIDDTVYLGELVTFFYAIGHDVGDVYVGIIAKHDQRTPVKDGHIILCPITPGRKALGKLVVPMQDVMGYKGIWGSRFEVFKK